MLTKQFTLEKSLKFLEDPSNGTNAVRIKADAVDNDYQLMLPPDLPADSSAKYLTSTTGGQLAWETAGGGGSSALPVALQDGVDWAFHTTGVPHVIPPFSTANCGRIFVFRCFDGSSNFGGNGNLFRTQNIRLPAAGTLPVGWYCHMQNLSHAQIVNIYTHSKGASPSSNSTDQIILAENLVSNMAVTSSNQVVQLTRFDRIARLILTDRTSGGIETYVLCRNN